ncbi:hypothetical protein V7111_15795 [Neobacillus niacini]|uniref:hypothetical protein n=1 Tax=Neobacillus niacini TaxID=86668 RepID=UPI0030015272
MHFRQFLISALMVGAALLFPDNAFAEKNAPSPQKGNGAIPVKSEKEEVNIALPPKAEHAKPQEKAAPKNVPVTEKTAVPDHAAVPEHALINKAEAKQLSSQSIPNQAAVKDLPERAKGIVKSELNENEKTHKETGLEKAAAVNANSQGQQDKSIETTSLSATDKEVRVEEAIPAKSVSTAKAHGDVSVITIEEPDAQEQKNGPANKGEIPKVSQLNQTQRSNSTGGQSNDRVSNGLSNISVLDKWFEWSNYFEIKFDQSYLSRQDLLNTQWVNAPPAPPPQKAPLLTNVTRS